jgi:hypothetical protein
VPDSNRSGKVDAARLAELKGHVKEMDEWEGSFRAGLDELLDNLPTDHDPDNMEKGELTDDCEGDVHAFCVHARAAHAILEAAHDELNETFDADADPPDYETEALLEKLERAAEDLEYTTDGLEGDLPYWETKKELEKALERIEEEMAAAQAAADEGLTLLVSAYYRDTGGKKGGEPVPAAGAPKRNPEVKKTYPSWERRARERREARAGRRCEHCGKKFTPRNSLGKTCSARCRVALHRRK